MICGGDVMRSGLLTNISENNCPCGKKHIFGSKVITGAGSVEKLPEILKEFRAEKVFVLADVNTFRAAGERVLKILERNGISSSLYEFKNERLEPDESAVGLAAMNFDTECDAVLGVGSGVINDIGKILSNIAGKPYIIVATAPSMDGYASASSSMSVDGLKISLPSKSADCIIGDTDILKEAPERMLISGIGDMLAKYISLCEWRISNIITGEYYCEDIAYMVRSALKECVLNADGLLKRRDKAIEAVFEGRVCCGIAMSFAGISRPASGVEHYISHIWDMRGLEFGTKVDLHGIQCAVGTMYASKVYEKLKNYTPDREKALEYVKAFDYDEYKKKLKAFLGRGADAMTALEEKEQKYSVEKHRERLNVIIDNWDKIKKLIDGEIPSPAELEKLYKKIKMPETAEEIGIEESVVPATFEATKDIRDKYVLSRLCWDLGITDGVKEKLL